VRQQHREIALVVLTAAATAILFVECSRIFRREAKERQDMKNETQGNPKFQKVRLDVSQNDNLPKGAQSTGTSSCETRYDPRENGALCDECPRRTRKPVPPEGPIHGEPARWVWLGQDPGQTEERLGRPFVGATGILLSRIWESACAKLGRPIPRGKIWITNAALCRPLGSGEKEARRAVVCCRPRLVRELGQATRGAAILSMGKWAYFALTGETKGISKYIGFYRVL